MQSSESIRLARCHCAKHVCRHPSRSTCASAFGLYHSLLLLSRLMLWASPAWRQAQSPLSSHPVALSMEATVPPQPRPLLHRVGVVPGLDLAATLAAAITVVCCTR